MPKCHKIGVWYVEFPLDMGLIGGKIANWTGFIEWASFLLNEDCEIFHEVIIFRK